MALFKAIKRALGFQNHELDDVDVDYVDGNLSATPYVNPFRKPETAQLTAPQQPQAQAPTTYDTTMSDELLTAVVKLINENLSPLVANNLDINAERKQIAEKLAPIYQAELQRALEHNHDQAMAKLKAETEELRTRADQYKQKYTDAEEQRRAANTRATTLSNKILTLESQVEQLDLEKKSMLNKIKVMQLTAEKETDTTELEQKIKDLTQERNQLQEQVTKLQTEAQNYAELEKTLEEELQRITEFKERKNAELSALKAELQQARERAKADTEKIGELRLKLAQAAEEKTAADQVRNRRDVELANRIDALKAHVAERDERIRQLTERETELAQNLHTQTDALNTAKLQATQLKEDYDMAKLRADRLQTELDQTKAEHQKQLHVAQNQIAELTATVEQLRTEQAQPVPVAVESTPVDIEPDPDLHQAITHAFAEPEHALGPQSETTHTTEPIAEPQYEDPNPTEPTKNTAEQPTVTPAVEEPVLPDLDTLDDLDGDDWLVPTPPEPRKPKADDKADSADESKNKDNLPDERQMTLF